MKIDNMTPEQKREAIASACGKKNLRWIGKRLMAGTGARPTMVSDYLNDLRAMAQAVQSLDNEGLHAYAVTLASMFWPMGWNDWCSTLAVSEATAAQRADAFLLCLPEPQP